MTFKPSPARGTERTLSEQGSHTAKVEKAIKTCLCEFGIGLYDTTKTPIVDTMSKHKIFYVLSYVAFYMTVGLYAYSFQHALWGLHLIKQVQWQRHSKLSRVLLALIIKSKNAMKHASRGAFITQLEKYCRGMVAHFRSSSKVIIICCLHTIHMCTIKCNFYVSSTGNDIITQVER